MSREDEDDLTKLELECLTILLKGYGSSEDRSDPLQWQLEARGKLEDALNDAAGVSWGADAEAAAEAIHALGWGFTSKGSEARWCRAVGAAIDAIRRLRSKRP